MKDKNSINKVLFWFSLLMAFPMILLFGTNISIFLFIYLFITINKSQKGFPLKFNTISQWAVLFFALAAIISVSNLSQELDQEGLTRAIIVLPNYIYWSILVIFFISVFHLIELKYIYKGVFWGTLITIIYFLFLNSLLKGLPLFKGMSQNGFAFLLICFSPIALYYTKRQKGQIWALLLLLFIVLILLREGRRAGTVLVLFEGLAVLVASKRMTRNVVSAIIAIPILFLLLNLQFVNVFIYENSERIHGLIYNTEDIAKVDRSYLLRVAMIEKGMELFNDNPYTGIGLNNFTNYDIDFQNSFEGAEFVIYKKGIDEKSAHNSYISVLAEGGLLLFIPFILILLIPLFHFIFKFDKIPEMHRPFYFAFVGMTVHLYFISAILNVFAWFLIAICSALTYKK